MKKAPLHFKFVFLLFAGLLFSLPVSAIEEDVIYLEEESQEQLTIKEKLSELPKCDFQNRQYLLGDFRGYRTKLQERGIDIQSFYVIDSFIMRNNSRNSTKGTYQGLYNLSVELDSEKLNLYKGGKLFMLYQVGNKGVNSMEYLDTYSDMSSFNPSRSINQISELYYEHSFKDDLFNIKIGKQDSNVDFQHLNNGAEFLNLSFSYIDNTPMPLFPAQQMGVRARLKLPKDIYIQNGFYDGNLKSGSNPKGFFTGENNYLNMTEVYKLTNFKGKEGKYMLGGWIKTGEYDSFKNSTEHNNYGLYAAFEQKLTGRFEDKSVGLSAFGQFGYARNSINAVPYYFGAGLVFKGITKRRKEDSVGIAFGWHQFDRQLHKVENRTAEKVIELFYKIKLTEYLFIQPDIQYIIKPGGNNKNAFAVGLRSIIVF